MERKTIYLCLAHMSEAGLEQKYVKEAFDTRLHRCPLIAHSYENYTHNEESECERFLLLNISMKSYE